MADMIFDHTDVDGLNFDVIPLDGGGVRVSIFAAGKCTTTRVVDLPTETALDLWQFGGSVRPVEITAEDAAAIKAPANRALLRWAYRLPWQPAESESDRA